jgi:hypothetical protein
MMMIECFEDDREIGTSAFMRKKGDGKENLMVTSTVISGVRR